MQFFPRDLPGHPGGADPPNPCPPARGGGQGVGDLCTKAVINTIIVPMPFNLVSKNIPAFLSVEHKNIISAPFCKLVPWHLRTIKNGPSTRPPSRRMNGAMVEGYARLG